MAQAAHLSRQAQRIRFGQNERTTEKSRTAPPCGGLCDAWRDHVRLEARDGVSPQRPSDRCTDDGLYNRLSRQGAHSALRVRLSDGTLRRIRTLVDPVPLRLDGALGSDDASAEKNEAEDRSSRIYGRLRAARTSLWRTVCPLASTPFWTEFQTNDRLGGGRLSV